jgi:hypothetical protein
MGEPDHKSTQIKKCPVTILNAEAAYKIWGLDIPMLGKTMRKTPEAVIMEIVCIPKEIQELH